VPSAANVLHVVQWVQLSSFAAVSTDVSLAPGYERALAYNLALEIAPEYEATPSPFVTQIAMQALELIKRANQRMMLTVPENADLFAGTGYDIFADQ
jgi:hypothetical protein